MIACRKQDHSSLVMAELSHETAPLTKPYTKPFSATVWGFLSWRPLQLIRIQGQMLDLLVFGFLVGFNFAVMWFVCGFSCWSSAKAAGKALGTLAQWNFMLCLIPITRMGVFYYFLRIPFERLIVFHRWLGRWVRIELDAILRW